jgi:hypothetical protein
MIYQPLKVSDLIERLQEMNPDAVVVIPSSDSSNTLYPVSGGDKLGAATLVALYGGMVLIDNTDEDM